MTAIVLILGLKSLLIAAMTLGILRLAHSRSAAERSTIAHLGLFALVALPLATLLLPSLSIATPQFMAAAPVEPMVLPAEPMPAPNAINPITETPVAPVAQESAAPLSQPPSLAERAAPLARYAYALPAIGLLVLTLVALLRLVSLRARAQVMIDPHWLNALGRAQHRMGFKSGTALLTSSELRSPISWGLLRPTIVVNDDALVAGDQAEAIIAHELAHVIQLDWAKLMLARVATAVFWFNPLAWVLAREAHQLREEAADDAVLGANIAGTDYAQLLVGIARHENHRLLLGAHGVAPGKNSLHRRVARVLDNASARSPSGRSWVAGFTAGMMVMAAPLAAVTFGPARAASEEAEAAPVQAAAATPSSWSTRAGEGPNQVSSEPKSVDRHKYSAELANAVHGLSEPAPLSSDMSPGDFVSDEGAWVAAGTPEFAAAMEKFGEAMGERYARAFAVRPAPAASSAPAARPMPHDSDFNFDFNFDFDDFASKARKNGLANAEAALGATQEYRKDLADAGFANPSRGELLQSKAAGLDADYVRTLREAGLNGTLRDYAQAKSAGLEASYIRGMNAAGVTGSFKDYRSMRALGVSVGYVKALREAGLSGSPQDYIKARNMGLSSSYVTALSSLGVEGSLQEYGQMFVLGITSKYVRALHDNGNHITRASRLIELKTQGDRRADDS